MILGSPHPFRLSIDLDAEIRKITQRQSLNDVHYLVQLVRHALAHRPSVIEIRSTRHTLELSQDGRNFQEDEWLLLEALQEGRNEPAVIQQRLSLLEEKHGIAMLALILTFPSVRIATADRLLEATDGHVRFFRNSSRKKGYLIEVRRHTKALKAERNELEFFCAGAAVPIYYNRKLVTSPIQLPDQILVTRSESRSGCGVLGIPERGDLSTFTYYKGGVRFGVKRFVPHDGQIVSGYWNSSLLEFEAQFRQSISGGDAFFREERRALYQAIAPHFSKLAPEQKTRVKKILLGFEPDGWASAWGTIPLFHSCRTPVALTLEDLLRLAERFEAIPFCIRRNPHLPPHIPHLQTEDMHFIGHRLALPLTLVHPNRRVGGLRGLFRRRA